MLRFFEKNYETDFKQINDSNDNFSDFRDWLKDELATMDIFMNDIDEYAYELYDKYIEANQLE